MPPAAAPVDLAALRREREQRRGTPPPPSASAPTAAAQPAASDPLPTNVRSSRGAIPLGEALGAKKLELERMSRIALLDAEQPPFEWHGGLVRQASADTAPLQDDDDDGAVPPP